MGRRTKEPANYKICKSTCGKLSARTRRDHYLRVSRESIRPVSPPPQPNCEVDMDDEGTPLPFRQLRDDFDSSVAHLRLPASVESDWDYEMSVSEDAAGNLEGSITVPAFPTKIDLDPRRGSRIFRIAMAHTEKLTNLKDFIAFDLAPLTAVLLVAEDRNKAIYVGDASNYFGGVLQPDSGDDPVLAKDLHRANLKAMKGNFVPPFTPVFTSGQVMGKRSSYRIEQALRLRDARIFVASTRQRTETIVLARHNGALRVVSYNIQPVDYDESSPEYQYKAMKGLANVFSFS
ncbi:hypothetical protein B0H11DRAFT_1906196 [Mycena galericulata]|nr:hypothetical protein B0H11DRAFT_1906196 [Mycena galericulata]